MDRSAWMERFRRWKLPFLLLIAGLLLLIGSGHGSSAADSKQSPEAEPSREVSLAEEEKRLASLLSEIEGVGTVKVLLSYETTMESEYVSDEGETVVLSTGGGGQAALTKLKRYPRYLGAVIVCEGAERAAVRLNVMEAVARFTGLGADRITVLQLRN